MVGVPRSQQFIIGQLTTQGYTPAFTVPANHIALIKAIDIRNLSSVVNSVNFGFTSATAGVIMTLGAADLAVNEMRHWDIWTVAHPGDLIFAQVFAAPTTIVISGALLAGAPLAPPASFNGPASLVLEMPSTQPT